MTIQVRIYGEQTWAANRKNWRGALAKVKNQIKLALNDASEARPQLGDYDVKFENQVTPAAPDPTHLYNFSENLPWWDRWLDERDAYAEDATMLIVPAWGGVTFGSGRNPDTTTRGVMSLVGGQSITADNGIATTGKSEHYHDLYNALHELSHQLDAQTYWGAYGKYYEDEDGDWHRTPTNTQNRGVWSTYDVRESVETPDRLQDCEHEYYHPEYHGNTYWDLTYTDCAARTMYDETPGEETDDPT